MLRGTLPECGVLAFGNQMTLTFTVNYAASFTSNHLVYAAARSNGDVLNSDWRAPGSVQPS